MNPQGRQATDGSHERRDADALNLFLIATLLLLMIGVCLLVCLGLVRKLNRTSLSATGVRAQTVGTIERFPSPHLIVQPGRESFLTDKTAETKLSTYGWVDRAGGKIRIPISRAMELLLERGLPEAGAGQTRLQLMQSHSAAVTQPAPSPGSADQETQP